MNAGCQKRIEQHKQSRCVLWCAPEQIVANAHKPSATKNLSLNGTFFEEEITGGRDYLGSQMKAVLLSRSISACCCRTRLVTTMLFCDVDKYYLLGMTTVWCVTQSMWDCLFVWKHSPSMWISQHCCIPSRCLSLAFPQQSMKTSHWSPDATFFKWHGVDEL